jgi:aldehyde dehydrogenase (NAD+)
MSADHTDVPGVAEGLRSSFASGKTRSLEWRKGQLQAFLKMMKEGTPALLAGLGKDLHKSAHEGMAMELGGVMGEAKLMLANLDDWAAPTEVPCPPPNQPGSAWIHHDPLGTVLVIGAWNYPVYLTMSPIIGAIAGGNCVCVKMPSDKYSGASSSTMARLIQQYMDPDCVRVVEGDRSATQAVLQERWDLIFFTGGAMVGTMVAEAAAKNLTPTILELGGKVRESRGRGLTRSPPGGSLALHSQQPLTGRLSLSQSPAIVDKTANVEVAARRAVWGTFTNA